jgi:hypothetical protein
VFDRFRNPDHDGPKWIGAKVVAGAAAGMLLSLGLCGLRTAFHFGTGIGVINLAAIVIFVLSFLLGLTGGVLLLVEAIVAMIKRK